MCNEAAQNERDRCLRILESEKASFDYFDAIVKQADSKAFPSPDNLWCRLYNLIQTGKGPMSFDEQWELEPDP